MKNIIAIVALASSVFVTTAQDFTPLPNAPTAAITLAPAPVATDQAPLTGTGLWGIVQDFVAQNPTNTWDVTTYGIYNAKTYGMGFGSRIGFWLNPSIGMALDVSYCDGSWTFATLGLAARGTINTPFGTLSPYVTTGPGWNIAGASLTVDGISKAQQTIVAFAGGGVDIHIKGLNWFDFIGEYNHITTTPPQDRVEGGITRKF